MEYCQIGREPERFGLVVRAALRLIARRGLTLNEVGVPPKMFRVASGYEAVNGYVAFGPGLVVEVEWGERLVIYVVDGEGNRAARIGSHRYSNLSRARPPRGLLAPDR